MSYISVYVGVSECEFCVRLCVCVFVSVFDLSVLCQITKRAGIATSHNSQEHSLQMIQKF